MRGKPAYWTIIVALALTGVLATAGQPRASAQADTSEVKVIRGRVISANDNARPLRGARLTVIGSSDEPVLADGEGRFVARVTAPYTLRITKAGFAPAVVNVGAAGPADLQIALSPGAVLTGVVVDELGFPVADARIRARRLDVAASDGTPVAEFVADADDAGTYRIGNLPAGRYAIHSEPQMRRMSDVAHVVRFEMESRMMEMRRAGSSLAPPRIMSEVAEVSVSAGQEAAIGLVHRARAVSEPDSPIAGAVSGAIFDEFGDPLEDVTLRLWRVRYSGDRSTAYPVPVQRQTDDRGQYRLSIVLPGRYLLVASLEGSPYAATYYPGVTTILNATPLVVGRREEVTGINMTVTRVRAARVTGVALNAAGQPLEGLVTLTSSRRFSATALSPRIVRTTRDGAFDFANVAPGEYVLRATRAGAGQAVVEFATRFVTVDGPDPAPVVIATRPMATLRGRIVIEGNPGNVAVSDLRLIAIPDADAGPIVDRPFAAFIAGDRFELHGLAGPSRITLSSAPAGLWLKSADVAGVNAAEYPVPFAGPDDSRSDVTVVVSSASATMTGRVADEAGRAVDDYRVVAFSMNRDKWFAGSPHLRITGGPEADGGFIIRSLPPGDYWVVALDAIDGDGDSGDWQNPDVLASLITAAARVSLEEGQRAVTNLRLTRWAR
jgi:protocatechuate 3,4-dioxygenase beta subunit